MCMLAVQSLGTSDTHRDSSQGLPKNTICWEAEKKERETPDPQGPIDDAKLSEALPSLDRNESRQEAKALGNPRKASTTCTPWMTLALPIQSDPPYLTLMATSVLLGFFSKATEEESKQNRILQLWRQGPHLRKQNEASVSDVICHLPCSFLYQSFTTQGW